MQPHQQQQHEQQQHTPRGPHQPDAGRRRRPIMLIGAVVGSFAHACIFLQALHAGLAGCGWMAAPPHGGDDGGAAAAVAPHAGCAGDLVIACREGMLLCVFATSLLNGITPYLSDEAYTDACLVGACLVSPVLPVTVALVHPGLVDADRTR